MTEKTDADRIPVEPVVMPLCCPQCKSTKISGLMAAFWVALTAEETLDGQWSDYEGCTEIGEERLCADCGHEF